MSRLTEDNCVLISSSEFSLLGCLVLVKLRKKIQVHTDILLEKRGVLG